jgi:ribonuclease HI
MSDLFTIHTDGAARGNPGPAAFAYVIARHGQPDIEDSGCLGTTTNNIAEYTALLKALERARQLGGQRLSIHSDSELMIKQMKGEYKVKNEGLRPLYEQARQLCHQFAAVTFHHVRREQNKRADELCNLALDGDSKTARPSRGQAQRSGALDEPPETARSVRNAQSAGAHGSGSGVQQAHLPDHVRDEALDCLRSVAVAWSYGNPNHPRPEEVWEQLWSILEEGGVLKTVRR